MMEIIEDVILFITGAVAGSASTIYYVRRKAEKQVEDMLGELS